tara:strand:+ start:699 stop:968 length:270 start_codon:yes stop_codon:yes gene_type:complete
MTGSAENMKNSLTDLNNHLFAQMERLGDESIKGEALEDEIGRARAVAGIADRIINNASTIIRAHEVASEVGKLGSAQGKVLGIEDQSNA